MKSGSRLSDVLHLVLHLAESDTRITSERLAGYARTNPVVVRRLLSGLRRAGIVDSGRGHGGGWRLTCDLATVSLYDIYCAIDRPALFAIAKRNDAPDCLVERAVNNALDRSLNEAEALLVASFREVSLARLSRDFHELLQRHLAGTGMGGDIVRPESID